MLCYGYLLFDSCQQSEVQIVHVPVEEALIVDKHQASGVVFAVDDVCQGGLVRVGTALVVAQTHTRVLRTGPEATAAPVQAPIHLHGERTPRAWLQNDI